MTLYSTPTQLKLPGCFSPIMQAARLLCSFHLIRHVSLTNLLLWSSNQRISKESNQPLNPPIPSHHHSRKIRSLQATDKCALHAASLSLTAEQNCRLSRAAGWLEGRLVPSCPALWLEFSSGPPVPSRAAAHNLVSASCLHERQQASGRLETPCGRNTKLWGSW